MKHRIEYLTLSEQDVASTLKGNVERVFSIIEESLSAYERGDVIFPDKVSQIFNKETQARINCMPATILPLRVSGVKWVSVFPPNPAIGCQNVSGIIVLSEIETGFPIAVMDGTLLTSVRTAAVGAIASKFLAKSQPVSIGFIGAGLEARMHFTLLKHMHPTLTKCYLSSRTSQTEDEFVTQLQSVFPDVEFIKCKGDNSKSVRDADIIVTAVSCQLPLLKAKDMKEGCFYVHVGGWEDEFAVPLLCDKIVCDEWNAVKHRSQTLSRMYMQGLLHDSDIYADLVEIILGRKSGRTNNEERIYFNSVGLSYIDVYLAYMVYNEAVKQNLGRKVLLCDKSIINYNLFSR